MELSNFNTLSLVVIFHERVLQYFCNFSKISALSNDCHRLSLIKFSPNLDSDVINREEP